MRELVFEDEYDIVVAIYDLKSLLLYTVRLSLSRACSSVRFWRMSCVWSHQSISYRALSVTPPIDSSRNCGYTLSSGTNKRTHGISHIIHMFRLCTTPGCRPCSDSSLTRSCSIHGGSDAASPDANRHRYSIFGVTGYTDGGGWCWTAIADCSEPCAACHNHEITEAPDAHICWHTLKRT